MMMHGADAGAPAAFWDGQLTTAASTVWRTGQAPVLLFIAATVPLVNYTVRVGSTDDATGTLQLPASLVLPPGATLSLSVGAGTALAYVTPDPRGSAWAS